MTKFHKLLTPPDLFIISKSKAFTLAEVLITLGIIGVVAAMTIPTLLNNAQDKELKVAWKKNYSEINQALQMIKSDKGDLAYTSASPASHIELLNDLKSKISMINSSTSSAYFHSVTSGSTWSNLKGEDCGYPNSGYPSGTIKSGSVFYIDEASSTKGRIIIDVNGYKKPNIIGKDIFALSFFPDGRIAPVGGYIATTYVLGSTNTSKCYEASVPVSQVCDNTQIGWGCSATYLLSD